MDDRIRKFMYGRYGPDELYKFQMVLYFITLILVIFIKRKQYIAIQDWPGFPNNEGSIISKNIFIVTLKIIKSIAELNGITEGVAR